MAVKMNKLLLVISLIAISCVVLDLKAFSKQTHDHNLARENLLRSKFIGKTIVITGASSGFGKGLAIMLSFEGANLVIASRRAEVLQDLCRCIASQCSSRVLPITTDVTKQADVERLVEVAVSNFGHIDVWINAAGVGAIGRFVDIPVKDQAQIVQTDLIGVIYGSHCALQQFEKQKFGTLINIASIVGELPLAYYTTYSAAKSGVIALDRGLRAELKADHIKNIHICTVLPMATDTPFWTHAANYSKHTLQPPYLHKPVPVVKAIEKLIEKPKDTLSMGLTAKIIIAMHRFKPEAIEDIAARSIKKTQMDGPAPSAVPTAGALLAPMEDGTGMEGGVTQRMKSEQKGK